MSDTVEVVTVWLPLGILGIVWVCVVADMWRNR